MTKRIVIGSRSSALAMAQSEWVKAQLEAMDPDCAVEIHAMQTEGDKRLDTPLAAIGGKGLFTYELEEKLRNGAIDIAVHSLKDMPQKLPEDLPIIALSKRADPHDALILPAGRTLLDGYPKFYGTCSPRRVMQLSALFPYARFGNMRGNVNTRLKKLDAGECDALVLAAAGLRRLGLEARMTLRFSTRDMIPAAGQGILAIQGRADASGDLLQRLDDADSRVCYAAESAFLRALGADCTSPVGAFARPVRGGIRFNAAIEAADHSPLRGEINGSRDEAEDLGRALADRLRAEAEGHTKA